MGPIGSDNFKLIINLPKYIFEIDNTIFNMSLELFSVIPSAIVVYQRTYFSYNGYINHFLITRHSEQIKQTNIFYCRLKSSVFIIKHMFREQVTHFNIFREYVPQFKLLLLVRLRFNHFFETVESQKQSSHAMGSLLFGIVHCL